MDSDLYSVAYQYLLTGSKDGIEPLRCVAIEGLMACQCFSSEALWISEPEKGMKMKHASSWFTMPRIIFGGKLLTTTDRSNPFSSVKWSPNSAITSHATKTFGVHLDRQMALISGDYPSSHKLTKWEVERSDRQCRVGGNISLSERKAFLNEHANMSHPEFLGRVF